MRETQIPACSDGLRTLCIGPCRLNGRRTISLTEGVPHNGCGESKAQRSRHRGWRLLDEESFAKLVAANERLHGAKASEKVLNFAVLIDALCGAQHFR
jgi:hypothetical protein